MSSQYLKTSAPAEDEISQGNADILVDDLTMSLRRIIVPEDSHGADDGDTGGVGGNKDNALLVVRAFVARVAFAHDDVQPGARVTRAADPPGQAAH